MIFADKVALEAYLKDGDLMMGLLDRINKSLWNKIKREKKKYKQKRNELIQLTF